MHIENWAIDWRVIGMPWHRPRTIHRSGCRCRHRHLISGTWFCGSWCFGQTLVADSKIIIENNNTNSNERIRAQCGHYQSYFSITMPYANEKLNSSTWRAAQYVLQVQVSRSQCMWQRSFGHIHSNKYIYVFCESSLVAQTINNSVLAFGILISIASLRSILFHYCFDRSAWDFICDAKIKRDSDSYLLM